MVPAIVESAPKVGILIPTYQRTQYMVKALASAAGQTYSSLEIIVIDNGQSDQAKEVANGLGDTRVRYERNQQNLGLIGSIRKGVGMFSDAVHWITVLPDDDLLDADFTSSMVEFTAGHSAIEVVHGQRLLIDETGKQISRVTNPPDHESAISYLVHRALFERMSFLGGTFFKRSAYDEVGGYPQFTTGMATDDALIFRLAISHGLFFNPGASASIRQYPDAESHSSDNALAHIRSFEDYRDYVLEFCDSHGRFTNRQRSLVRSAVRHFTGLSISGQWLQRVRALLPGETEETAAELAQLYALTRERHELFSSRIRNSAQMAEKLGWNPERSFIYRLINDQIQGFRLNRVKASLRRSLDEAQSA